MQDIILKETRDNNNGTGQPMDIDRLIMGMASQLSEREDNFVVEDLRGFFFTIL